MGNMNVTVIDQNNVNIAVTPTPTQTINIDRGIIGVSGLSGYSGYSGYSGIGSSGYSGLSGYSGYSGISGWSGESGTSGYSGYSGIGESGYSGFSGYSGDSGISGYSGDSGISGYSGESGISGYSGYSGQQGTSINVKGEVPTVGDLPPTGNQVNDAYIVTADGNLWVWNGTAWYDAGQIVGPQGLSGFSGYSGESGYSGFSGDSGISGWSGDSGISGFSGDSGISGWSGFSGESGYSGLNGDSGYSGISGYSGFSGDSGISGWSGDSGISGYSGDSGISGWSGYSGYSGLGFTPLVGGQAWATDGSLINTNVFWYVPSPPDTGAFAVGNFILLADQTSTSTYFYYGRITLIQYAGGFGWAIHADILGDGGTPVGGSSSSWITELTGEQGISGYSGISGWSGISGYSGYSGIGTSGYSGFSGYSGYSGAVGAGGTIGNWGSFWDTTTQTTTINTPTPITFNSYDLDNTGVSIGSPISRIVFANSGTYSLTFSIQFTNRSTALGSTQIWLKKNGTNIPDTNSHFDVPDKQGSAFSSEILTVNFVFNVTATDYVQLYWDTTNADVSLETIAGNGTYPRTPSVIFTATQVMYGQSGYSGISGYSGYSGFSGISGFSGFSGISGYSGSGVSGWSGASGYSGYSGEIGTSGYSGYSGISGTNGASGFSGISGYSGYSGIDGASGFSGYSGISGYSGSGVSGYSGFSGISGYSGYSGITPTIGGSNTQVQYNNSGVLGGSANFTYNGTTLNVTGTASNQITFLTTATGSDLLRIQPQASGTGVYLQATDNGQTAYAKMGFYATDYIFNTGNVGINCSPSYKFEVQNTGSSGATMHIQGQGLVAAFDNAGGNVTEVDLWTNGTQRATWYWNGGVGTTYLTSTTGNLAFSTNGNDLATERLRITNTSIYTASGVNVGIGTSSPSANLDVGNVSLGAAAPQEIRVNNSSGNSVYRIGQGSTSHAYLAWFYNATAGSAYASLSTYAGNNNLVLQDSGGNVGLGVTPSAWGAFKAFEMPDGSYFSTYNFGGLYIGNNNYYNGSNFIYKNTGAASLYTQGAGTHVFSTVASGTAGNTITFSERMRLDSSGNLGIATTSPVTRLDVVKTTSGLSAQSNTVLALQSGSSSNWIEFMNGGTTNNAGIQWSDAGSLGSASFFYNNNTQSMYYGSEAIHQFYTAGTERMRITSAGNVGIGTTSPTAPLDVTGATVGYINLDGSSGTGQGSFIRFRKGGTDIAYMGTSSAILGDTSSDVIIYADGARNATTWTNGVERMRIDSSGNLLIGTASQIGTTPSKVVIKFDNNNFYGLALGGSASGTAGMVNFYNSAGTEQGYISSNGSGITLYSTTSDYRLKENIVPMTGALAKVAQLKPVTYRWKESGLDGQGFIAHELAEVVPDCVSREKDGVDVDGKPVYQGVDTSFLVATLVSAIQELKAEFDAYKATHP
jgi:hypothetical protein